MPATPSPTTATPAATRNAAASGNAPRSSFAIDIPDSLLASARAGAHAALEQIYRRFERPVYTLALRICGDREEAAEVLQDTMLKVIHRIDDYQGRNGAPFWGWLRQVAVNESLMRLRHNRKLAQETPDDETILEAHCPPPAAAADAAQLQRALAALPATTRTVLWLYHAEGYTHEEIGTLMQRTPSFSKSQVARGTRRLRELLDPTPSDPTPPNTVATAGEVSHA